MNIIAFLLVFSSLLAPTALASSAKTTPSPSALALENNLPALAVGYGLGGADSLLALGVTHITTNYLVPPWNLSPTPETWAKFA